ncbi:MAG: SLC13 family permease, partial [Candidatus Anstonellales archaeon]
TDFVLEIGAGTGFLTREIQKKAKVIAFELDKDLFELLSKKLPKKNLSLFNENFLKAKNIPSFNKIVCAPPYHISSDIMHNLLFKKFDKAVLLFQKEFCEKLLSKPGFKDYCSLSVLTQYFCDARIVEHSISPNSFYPKPTAFSALIVLDSKKRFGLVKNEKLFEKVYMDFSIFRSILVFLLVFALLVFHHQIEEMLHLQKNNMLLGAAFLGAGLAILFEREKARSLVETRVDWWTLTFFIMLFSSVGALKYVGVTSWAAQRIIAQFGNDLEVLTAVIMFSSGLLSAMLDNVLAVASFIPVLESMKELGISSSVFWWALLFGGTLFGNLTVIGSTANIVAVGIAERNWGIKIGFLEWLRAGFIVTLFTTFVALALVYVLNGLWVV